MSALLVLFASAQPSGPIRRYEPLRHTPAWWEADKKAHYGKYAEAAQAFLAIAEQNKGTTLGAEAAFEAAFWSGRGKGVPIYEQIIHDYPRSRFEMHSRLALLQIKYPTGSRRTDLEGVKARTRGYLLEVDPLVQSYGGPSLRAVTSARQRERAASQLRALHPEYIEGLYAYYQDIRGAYMQLDDQRNVLEVAKFLRVAFPEYYTGATGDIENALIALGVLPRVSDSQMASPDVRLRYPREGAVVSPRPKIRLETSVGDYRFNQVDLQRSKLTIDGQSLPFNRIRAKYDQALRLGRPFEKLRIEAQPAQPLAPGTHTLQLEFIVGGYQPEYSAGKTILTRTFKVRQDCRDNDDDEWERWEGED